MGNFSFFPLLPAGACSFPMKRHRMDDTADEEMVPEEPEEVSPPPASRVSSGVVVHMFRPTDPHMFQW